MSHFKRSFLFSFFIFLFILSLSFPVCPRERVPIVYSSIVVSQDQASVYIFANALLAGRFAPIGNATIAILMTGEGIKFGNVDCKNKPCMFRATTNENGTIEIDKKAFYDKYGVELDKIAFTVYLPYYKPTNICKVAEAFEIENNDWSKFSFPYGSAPNINNPNSFSNVACINSGSVNPSIKPLKQGHCDIREAYILEAENQISPLKPSAAVFSVIPPKPPESSLSFSNVISADTNFFNPLFLCTLMFGLLITGAFFTGQNPFFWFTLEATKKQALTTPAQTGLTYTKTGYLFGSKVAAAVEKGVTAGYGVLGAYRGWRAFLSSLGEGKKQEAGKEGQQQTQQTEKKGTEPGGGKLQQQTATQPNVQQQKAFAPGSPATTTYMVNIGGRFSSLIEAERLARWRPREKLEEGKTKTIWQVTSETKPIGEIIGGKVGKVIEKVEKVAFELPTKAVEKLLGKAADIGESSPSKAFLGGFVLQIALPLLTFTNPGLLRFFYGKGFGSGVALATYKVSERFIGEMTETASGPFAKNLANKLISALGLDKKKTEDKGQGTVEVKALNEKIGYLISKDGNAITIFEDSKVHVLGKDYIDEKIFKKIENTLTSGNGNEIKKVVDDIRNGNIKGVETRSFNEVISGGFKFTYKDPTGKEVTVDLSISNPAVKQFVEGAINNAVKDMGKMDVKQQENVIKTAKDIVKEIKEGKKIDVEELKKDLANKGFNGETIENIVKIVKEAKENAGLRDAILKVDDRGANTKDIKDIINQLGLKGDTAKAFEATFERPKAIQLLEEIGKTAEGKEMIKNVVMAQTITKAEDLKQLKEALDIAKFTDEEKAKILAFKTQEILDNVKSQLTEGKVEEAKKVLNNAGFSDEQANKIMATLQTKEITEKEINEIKSQILQNAGISVNIEKVQLTQEDMGQIRKEQALNQLNQMAQYSEAAQMFLDAIKDGKITQEEKEKLADYGIKVEKGAINNYQIAEIGEKIAAKNEGYQEIALYYFNNGNMTFMERDGKVYDHNGNEIKDAKATENGILFSNVQYEAKVGTWAEKFDGKMTMNIGGKEYDFDVNKNQSYDLVSGKAEIKITDYVTEKSMSITLTEENNEVKGAVVKDDDGKIQYLQIDPATQARINDNLNMIFHETDKFMAAASDGKITKEEYDKLSEQTKDILAQVFFGGDRNKLEEHMQKGSLEIDYEKNKEERAMVIGLLSKESDKAVENLKQELVNIGFTKKEAEAIVDMGIKQDIREANQTAITIASALYDNKLSLDERSIFNEMPENARNKLYEAIDKDNEKTFNTLEKIKKEELREFEEEVKRAIMKKGAEVDKSKVEKEVLEKANEKLKDFGIKVESVEELKSLTDIAEKIKSNPELNKFFAVEASKRGVSEADRSNLEQQGLNENEIQSFMKITNRDYKIDDSVVKEAFQSLNISEKYVDRLNDYYETVKKEKNGQLANNLASFIFDGNFTNNENTQLTISSPGFLLPEKVMEKVAKEEEINRYELGLAKTIDMIRSGFVNSSSFYTPY